MRLISYGALLAAILALFVLSCENPLDSGESPASDQSEETAGTANEDTSKGIVKVLLTDCPLKGKEVLEVWINIQSVEIHSDEQGWHIVVDNRPEGVEYDILELVDNTALVGLQHLDAGDYTQIRLVLDRNNRIIVREGTEESEHALTIPSCRNTGIKLNGDFKITAGGTTEIVLDFIAAKSVVLTGKGKYILKPVVKIKEVRQVRGPDPTPPTVEAVAVAAGWYQSFALLSHGKVKAWGCNIYGQLGDGTRIDSNTPIAVSGITNAVDIAVGCHHTVALLSDGTVKAWGKNASGQLGDGTRIDSNTPVAVSGITNAVAVAAGQDHSLALLSDGTVKTWGWNVFGQLGARTTPYVFSNTPVTVSGITDAISITAGWYHSLALLSDGTVKAWGASGHGQLGVGPNVDGFTPVMVNGITNAVDIAAGAYHSVAVLSDGTVKTWGHNDCGQLGDGTDIILHRVPVMVVGIDTAVASAADSGQTVALLSDSTVEVWGIFYTGPPHNTPVKVSGITDAVAVASGYGHIVALLSDGTVKAWNHNSFGQLGDGTYIDSTIPVTVEVLD